MPSFYLTFMMVAMCHGKLGEEQEGRAACDKLLELFPDASEHLWDLLKSWNLPEELVIEVADGLEKAGMRVAERRG